VLHHIYNGGITVTPRKQNHARRQVRTVYIAANRHAALKAWAKSKGLLLSAVIDEAVSSYMVRKRIETEEVAA
jgi:hypothetical protein